MINLQPMTIQVWILTLGRRERELGSGAQAWIDLCYPGPIV